MERIEKVIEEVNGTMSIEGMPLTREDRERIRRCARDQQLVEAEIRQLVKKYSIPTGSAYDQRL